MDAGQKQTFTVSEKIGIKYSLYLCLKGVMGEREKSECFTRICVWSVTLKCHAFIIRN
jgi:hypothetical protein